LEAEELEVVLVEETAVVLAVEVWVAEVVAVGLVD
jgi:hypothetical protein